MRTLALAIFLFSVLFCKAQPTFFKTYGGTNKEEGKSLALCTDGGFIIGADITLITPDPDSSNVLIVRTNSSGDTLWTRIINSGENDFCVKIIQTSDLGFAVLANRVSSSGSKIVLIKLSLTGTILWNKTFSFSTYTLTAYSVIEKIQGGFLIAGTSWSSWQDGLLINTTPSGDTLWTRKYGHGSFAFYIIFHDVKQLADSSFVILGANYNINVFYPRMLRIDSSGNIIYAKEYDDGSLDDGIIASSAYMQESNKFVLAGNGRTNASNRFIVKFDSLFNIQWSQKFSFSTVNIISSIVQTNDSGFIFIAAPDVSTSSHYCLMIKTNSSGTVSWTKEFQYASLRSPHSIVLTPDNGIAFCGFFLDTISTHNKDIVFIKTDANGNTPCDGLAANVTNSPLSFITNTNSYNITGGMFMTTSALTVQGGIPINNLCFTTSANENYFEGRSDLTILPNPSTGTFVVNSTIQPFSNSTITISNTLGEKIYEQVISSAQTEINLSRQPAGIYFVQLRNEKQTETRKILLTK